MPWKVESMASEKQKFIILYLSGKFTKTELCKGFGISRPTGDAIITRYEQEGWDALEEHSRKHIHHPFKTAPKIEQAIVTERTKHHYWGGKKIRILLERDYDFGQMHIPSATTVNVILKYAGPSGQDQKRLRNKVVIYATFSLVLNDSYRSSGVS